MGFTMRCTGQQCWSSKCLPPCTLVHTGEGTQVQDWRDSVTAGQCRALTADPSLPDGGRHVLLLQALALGPPFKNTGTAPCLGIARSQLL